MKRASHPGPHGSARALPLTQEQLDDLPPFVTLAVGNIDGIQVLGHGRPRLVVSGARIGENEVVEIAGWCADPDARAPGAGLSQSSTERAASTSRATTAAFATTLRDFTGIRR